MNETTLNTVWNPADHRVGFERMAAGTLAVAGLVGLAWLAAMVYVIANWALGL